MICKDLQKFIQLQNSSKNLLGFVATPLIKKEINLLVNQLKNCYNYKAENIETEYGKFYKYSADVEESLFPYKAEIFFASLKNEINGNKEFFRVEIV